MAHLEDAARMDGVEGGTTMTWHKIKSERLEWREVDDEIVVLDLEGSVYLSVNASGKSLWLALVAGADVEELEQILQDGFGRSAAEAKAEAAVFLDRLGELGLVDTSDEVPQAPR
jgi:hypothetical protein